MQAQSVPSARDGQLLDLTDVGISALPGFERPTTDATIPTADSKDDISAQQGALPTLYAAVHPEVRSGDYVGPDGLGEWKGFPKKTQPQPQAKDEAAARQLWEVSEQLTQVRFGV